MTERKQPISYSIIRFQPHVETGEFANVGIVLVAPLTGYLDFRIETKRLARITGFFDSIETSLVKEALQSCQTELARVRALSGYANGPRKSSERSTDGNPEHLFRSLTKDREGIIRFSDVRFAMHHDPAIKLEELFDFYVARSFAENV